MVKNGRECPRVEKRERGSGSLKTIKNTLENLENYKNRNARPSAGAVADKNIHKYIYIKKKYIYIYVYINPVP